MFRGSLVDVLELESLGDFGLHNSNLASLGQSKGRNSKAGFARCTAADSRHQGSGGDGSESRFMWAQRPTAVGDVQVGGQEDHH